jgi:hypothetical protein
MSMTEPLLACPDEALLEPPPPPPEDGFEFGLPYADGAGEPYELRGLEGEELEERSFRR